MRAAEREENDPPRQRAEQAESDGSIKLKSAPCDPFRAPFPLFDLKRSQRDRISSPVVVRQQQSMSTLIRHGPRLDVPTRVNPRPAQSAQGSAVLPLAVPIRVRPFGSSSSAPSCNYFPCSALSTPEGERRCRQVHREEGRRLRQGSLRP